MKMSDLFELPMVTDGHSVMSQPSSPAGCVGEFVSDIECDSGKDAEYVAHAINNHDRLTEENAKLWEFIEKQIPFLNSVSAQKAQQLLNQLKDQSNDK